MIQKNLLVKLSLISLLCITLSSFYKHEKKVETFENSTFAIVKASYNSIGEKRISFSIIGTAFLLNDSTIITANHVLNKNIWLPSPGNKFVQYFLLKRNSKKIIEINKENLISFPEVETTLISLNEKFNCEYKAVPHNVNIGDSIYSFGHVLGVPKFKAHWEDKLILNEYNLNGFIMDNQGVIKSIDKVSVKFEQIHLTNKLGYQTSFKAQRGISGAPLFSEDKLIGMLSFGKSNGDSCYAISINEILNGINE